VSTNLFGERSPYPNSERRCSHLNWELRLPIQGYIDLKSTYEIGKDSVEETGRSVSWSGQVSGRCLDCGRQLYYGANMPKYLIRRLIRVTLPGFDPDEDLLANLKGGRR
jgi:hypothetical protein